MSSIALVHPAPFGVGGLGAQSANAAAGLRAGVAHVHLLGPGLLPPAPRGVLGRVASLAARWRAGTALLDRDRALGSAAARALPALGPDAVYAFTQVAEESLRWARAEGRRAILESPNGHIRNFGAVYAREAARWCGGAYRGHPVEAMVARVEREYEQADVVRVSSEWSRRSLVAGGVAADKVVVLQQAVDVERFQPAAGRPPGTGPLRLCFVGSLDLRKGFAYLLRGMRLAGASRFTLEIVGSTGDRCCRRLFARESSGLAVTCAPGDPVPAYHRAELFVFPTLEDGSPFAMAEAMACGLPAIVTDETGAAEWVEPGVSGWVVSAASEEAIATALDRAFAARGQLRDMGTTARARTLARAHPPACAREVGRWVADLVDRGATRG